MKLNEIANNPGATKNRKRIGRGIGSGTGKTGGRGVKGQKSRSGVAIKGYEGGQMPIYQRLPKRGFNSRNHKSFVPVNLGRLQEAIDAKKIDAAKTITIDLLTEAGLVKGNKCGVRLLASGEIKSKITIEVTGASAAAIAAVEKAGGTVIVTASAASAEVAE